MTVTAAVYGNLSVHEGRTLKSDRKWGITHVLCGLLVTHMDREADAKRMAQFLWDHYRAAFEMEDHDRSSKMIPQHVKDWVRKCRLDGRWYEPDFLGGNE